MKGRLLTFLEMMTCKSTKVTNGLFDKLHPPRHLWPFGSWNIWFLFVIHKIHKKKVHWATHPPTRTTRTDNRRPWWTYQTTIIQPSCATRTRRTRCNPTAISWVPSYRLSTKRTRPISSHHTPPLCNKDINTSIIFKKKTRQNGINASRVSWLGL